MSLEEKENVADISLLNEQIPIELFSSPIDFIFADHFRIRIMCKIIDKIAEQETTNTDEIRALRRFLKEDFVLHIEDEEEDLFPLLKRRGKPQDKIQITLDHLSAEHDSDLLDVEEISAVLRRIETDEPNSGLTPSELTLFKRFADNERHHLTIENAILLPLARARLTDDDLRSMAIRMAKRRGFSIKDNNNDHQE